MRSYAVSTDPTDCGYRFWFWCFVYDTQEELAKAAKKYSPHEDIDWDGTAGCFQPKWTAEVPSKGPNKGRYQRCRKTSFIGVMRLCKPYLTREILIHEACHAGINLVRAMALNVDFDLHQIENEEALCFATQHISEALIGVLL